MKLRYVNPGYEYMITQMMELQKEELSAFWSEPLFYFYPELNRDYVQSLSKGEREKYFEESFRKIYEEKQAVIDEKVVCYNKYWGKCKPQIEAALSDAFEIDCSEIFNDMKVGEQYVLDVLDEMYQKQPIREFMKNSYAYCEEHEKEIRAHIQEAEKHF